MKKPSARPASRRPSKGEADHAQKLSGTVRRTSDDLSKLFTPVIAYLLPVLVGLYGASFYAETLQGWFTTAETQQTSVGGFLFMLLAALGAGFVLSGLRCLIVDRCMPKVPLFDHGRRADERIQQAIEHIRVQHYAYYQFYANIVSGGAGSFVPPLTILA
jgi:hypothetical protein